MAYINIVKSKVDMRKREMDFDIRLGELVDGIGIQ